jgi:hypothetical protein
MIEFVYMARATVSTRVLFAVAAGAAVFALRVYAAEISDVTIGDVTDSSAAVSWKTDVETDATINYGLDSSVGTVRYPLFDKKSHLLTIQNLDPATTYHFRVVSTDAQGNKSATAGFVFTTANNQQAVANKVIKDLEKVTDPTELTRVVQKVQEQAADVIRPPSIIGSPKVEVTSDSATISWSSDRPSGSMVAYVVDADYQEGASDPYGEVQGSPNEAVTKHRVTIEGLEPATIYHFQVSSADTVGLTGKSEDDTFRTKSVLPDVEGVRVSRVQEDSAVVSWNTGSVLAKGRVEYKNMRTNVARTIGDPILTPTHSVQITGLEFGTRYTAQVFATNSVGEEASSKPFSFVTIRDVVPPAISKVSNESTLFPGEDTKVQTIISFETDEPTLCQVSYTQGLVIQEGPNGGTASMPKETNPLTDHTQVIVGFAPATVYKFWVDCEDETGNASRSEDFVLITPIKEKNIIDIILENFQGTFGWVNKIGK